MILSEEQWKFAIEDARTRHEAVVALLYANDAQALSILSLCVTLALATASGAIASFAKDSVVPHIFVLPLIAATLVFGASAAFCFVALNPATINLPGRDPNFWILANGDGPNDFADVAKSYLADLEVQRAKNNKVNADSALALRRAKFLCIFGPQIALIIAAGIEISR